MNYVIERLWPNKFVSKDHPNAFEWLPVLLSDQEENWFDSLEEASEKLRKARIRFYQSNISETLPDKWKTLRNSYIDAAVDSQRADKELTEFILIEPTVSTRKGPGRTR